MYYKIKEIADLAGVSIRTLHHYDDIKLLSPEKVTDAGYRIYSDKSLERLQQILFFKELDFSLSEIKQIMDNPSFDRKKALLGQKELLIEKKKRLEKIINTVDNSLKVIEGEICMNKDDMFSSFSMENIEEHKRKYAKETKEKYGETLAYKECEKKTSKYSKDDWNRISKETQEIYLQLAKIMDKEPSDRDVQELVDQWRNLITDNYYNCTLQIFEGLAEVYVHDERFRNNIDKTKVGLAQFLSDAIKVYCNNKR